MNINLDPKEKLRRQKERRQKRYNETHKIINNIVYKLCPLHKKYFPNEDEWIPCDEEHFSKLNNKTDGLHTYCKRCNNEKAKKRQKDLGQKALDYVRNQRVLKRKEYAKYKKIYRAEHREEEYIRGRNYRIKNPDKMREYTKKYSNKAHTISTKEWKDCKNYYKNKQDEWCCAYCGKTEKEHKEIYHQQLHKEHVDCNGANDLSNCIPACRHCNESKHDKNMEEWYKEQDFFSKRRLNKIYKWLNEDYKLYIKEKN